MISTVDRLVDRTWMSTKAYILYYRSTMVNWTVHKFSRSLPHVSRVRGSRLPAESSSKVTKSGVPNEGLISVIAIRSAIPVSALWISWIIALDRHIAQVSTTGHTCRPCHSRLWAPRHMTHGHTHRECGTWQLPTPPTAARAFLVRI